MTVERHQGGVLNWRLVPRVRGTRDGKQLARRRLKREHVGSDASVMCADRCHTSLQWSGESLTPSLGRSKICVRCGNQHATIGCESSRVGEDRQRGATTLLPPPKWSRNRSIPSQREKPKQWPKPMRKTRKHREAPQNIDQPSDQQSERGSFQRWTA